MAQNDFGTINPNTKSGTDLASDLNDFRDAVNSNHVGSSRPSYVVAGMTWVNNATNPWIFSLYDGTDDIKIGEFNTTTNVFSAEVSGASTTVAGIVELATSAEVQTGTDTTRAVTPKSVADAIGVTIQGYDADTAKLDVAQNWTAAQNFQDNPLERPNLLDYGETVNALGDLGGGTDDIDLTSGNVVTATVSTSTQTFTFSNPPASGTNGGFILYLTNGGSQTVNWPASVDWPGGTAPTLTSSGLDILVFNTTDGGTTWHGQIAATDSR